MFGDFRLLENCLVRFFAAVSKIFGEMHFHVNATIFCIYTASKKENVVPTYTATILINSACFEQ